ncbi:MAG: MBL fold metallo-hydrolase [Simkaniaceae bacterium]|nr:MBL fold metallo-hydrolase [Simkaniaceae bacterium]
MCAAAATAYEMKLDVLYDNRSSDAKMREGFGFACYIEWQGRKILFDTGGNLEAYLDNLREKGIKLDEITDIFFSHKHWDHTAGFEEVLSRLKEGTKVILPAPFPKSFDKKIPRGLLVIRVDSSADHGSDIHSIVLKGGVCGLYEQALFLNRADKKGVIVVTGCAHPGIIRIIRAAQEKLGVPVYMVIGGFHLHHSWSSTSAAVVKQFKELGVEKVAPCHCAGVRAMSQFKEAYGEDYILTATGTEIVV